MLLGGHHITAIEAKSRGLITEVYCHDTLRRNLIPNLKNLTQKSPQVKYAWYPQRLRVTVCALGFKCYESSHSQPRASCVKTHKST